MELHATDFKLKGKRIKQIGHKDNMEILVPGFKRPTIGPPGSADRLERGVHQPGSRPEWGIISQQLPGRVGYVEGAPE